MFALKSIEYIAVISGMIHVFLLTRGKVAAWPSGLLSVGLYISIFLQNKLYSDTLLHIVYVILNIYGWWNWGRSRNNKQEVDIERMQVSQQFFWSILIIAGFLVWGYGVQKNTDASFPYGDAFTTVASLVAQYLLAKRKLENWIIWIIVDIVAIQIYFLKGLYPTSALYGVYLILSIWGYISWQKQWKKYNLSIS